MPGMNNGLNINDPIVVAAFRHALLRQGLAAAALFALLIVAWVSVRELRPRHAADSGTAPVLAPESRARRLLRIVFGVLWILDGILQAQPGMAVGLPSQVIQPTAQSSPEWVRHLVNWAGTSWSYHPVQAAAGAVWIQIGIGLWLLLASRGRLSRAAGLASAGWGLVVWVFGESLGGILAPGLSWLTGAPGAALCYCAAGALVALPARCWSTRAAGRLMTSAFGMFLVVMAVLQAWPGRGFWQGELRGQPGSLAAMVQSMAALSQPSALGDLVSGFAGLVRSHGYAVNLAAVAVLAATGAALLTTRPRIVRPALVMLAAFCLADWVLVQDLGFFGGLGTDPNSMIPMFALAVAGYLALCPRPAPAAHPGEASTDPAEQGMPSGPAGWRLRLRPASLRARLAAASLAAVGSAGAVGLVLLGAVPMAAAQASPNASAILAQAVDGSSAPLNSAAPGFTLTDQDGRPVSLASLRGKAVLLTFLDPVCVTDCPLIAQEFREAGVLLGSRASRVELVAVNLNPLYRSTSYLRAFDTEELLSRVPDWRYLTGTPAQLGRVWKNYGVVSQSLPAGSMLGHSDAAFVISPRGRLVEELDFDPGPGTGATVSSFATELATAAGHALSSS